jgi:hypothetical protein
VGKRLAKFARLIGQTWEGVVVDAKVNGLFPSPLHRGLTII